jgi:hypothetical protein
MTKTRRLYSAALITATVAFASPAVSQQPMKPPKAGIEGAWSGAVQQMGGGSKSYAMLLTVTKAGGTTEYPDLKCAGKLTRVGSSGAYTFFTETITKGGVSQGGACINGSVTMLMTGNRLAWGWVGADAGAAIVASSTLARK